MRAAILLVLVFGARPSLAGPPTQVDPMTIQAHKRMLEASAKMDRASQMMLDASNRLLAGGEDDAARRDLVKGDALMRAGDAVMDEGERMLSAEGAMMDSSKLMLEARQRMMEGRAKLMSVTAQGSAPEQHARIQESQHIIERADEKMRTARQMMWNRMQMAR
jgi:hypothetical protein